MDSGQSMAPDPPEPPDPPDFSHCFFIRASFISNFPDLDRESKASLSLTSFLVLSGGSLFSSPRNSTVVCRKLYCCVQVMSDLFPDLLCYLVQDPLDEVGKDSLQGERCARKVAIQRLKSILSFEYLLCFSNGNLCFTVSVMRLSFVDSDVSLLSAILLHKICPTTVLGNLTLVDREYSSLAFGKLFFSIWEKSLPLSFSDGRYVQPYYLSWEKSLPSLSLETAVWCFTLLTDLTKLVSSMVKLGYIIRHFFIKKRLISTTSMECVYKSLASMAAHYVHLPSMAKELKIDLLAIDFEALFKKLPIYGIDLNSVIYPLEFILTHPVLLDLLSTSYVVVYFLSFLLSITAFCSHVRGCVKS